MNKLDMAILHDVKNELGAVALKLEINGGLESESRLIFKASGTINKMLLLNKRGRNGSIEISIDAHSPADLVLEVARTYSGLFPKVNVHCDVARAPDLWFYDETYVRVALANAVHNACHYCKENVNIYTLQSGSDLIFVVKDDGFGFHEDMVNDKSKGRYRKVSERGSGLGLMLCDVIAKSHSNRGKRGSVAIGNDGGAVFKFFLP